jgi:hypothetical protein
MQQFQVSAINTVLGAITSFVSGASRGRDLELSKEELIQVFRTITTIINLLQPSLTLSVSDSPESAPQALSRLPRTEARLLRILTAFAIALVRKKDVTAVVASHPQCPKDGHVQVIATSQHHFVAVRNPRTTHPKLKGTASGSRPYKLLTPSTNIKVDLSKPLTDLDPS